MGEWAWAIALVLKPFVALLILGIFFAAVGIGILVSKIAERILPKVHWLVRRFERDDRGYRAAHLADRSEDGSPLLLGHSSENRPSL